MVYPKQEGKVRKVSENIQKAVQNNEKISKIIEIEWNMFQNVNNIGGRASCQDDRETFVIMRRSQFENWPEELLSAYLDYIENAQRTERNLIAEKYGRMMRYTEPGYYEENIRPYIPALPAHSEQMIEEIIEIIVPWEKDFAAKYPKLGKASRPVTAEGDASGFTSMETYARGELGTYSAELLSLYLAYMKKLKAEGKSISVMDREVMSRLYGYDSIEEAENSL